MNPGTCLITGEKAGVCPYHLVQRHHWKNHPLLSRFEWSWGMKYDTIKLDTPQNTVLLCPDMRELFASGKLALMPSLDIIEKLWTRWEKLNLQSESIPPIDEIYDGKDHFEYRLLPLVADIPAITCPSDDSEKIAPAIYSYPFENMPVVISCVKPHFVVQAAGEILYRMAWSGRRAVCLAVSRIYGTSPQSAMDAVDTIRQSYISWVYQSPPSDFVCHPRIDYPFIFDSVPDEPLPLPPPTPYPFPRIKRSRSSVPYPNSSLHRGKRHCNTSSPRLALFAYSSKQCRGLPPRCTDGRSGRDKAFDIPLCPSLTGVCGDELNGHDLEGSSEQVVRRYIPIFGALLRICASEEKGVDDWVTSCAQTAASSGWESIVVNDGDVRDYN
ncbi:hypothetical protein EW146_g2489 [Bondarzewia mesenterica]|uniref:HNH nuclease domain-containing protein n=1 Tax=Bondarzewia mesenterica TaxID=1095465 RepID=A0A4S4M0L6_9AGAM|nr:hypothetical protein EW146_g2489 [Bondarzewia mesenterica]